MKEGPRLDMLVNLEHSCENLNNLIGQVMGYELALCPLSLQVVRAVLN